MTSKLFKLLFVSTGMAPILFTTYFVNFLDSYEKKGFNWGTFVEQKLCLTLIFISIILLFVCKNLIIYASKHLEAFEAKIESIKPMSNETFSFLLVYLFPLVRNPSVETNLFVLIFFVFIFFLVVYRSHSYHFNPLFSLFGYHCYQISTDKGVTYTFLTKRAMNRCDNLSKFVYITDYMILETIENEYVTS